MTTALQRVLSAVLLILAIGGTAAAATGDVGTARAPVVFHGATLFNVAAANAPAADRRAALVAKRVDAVANDPSVPLDAIRGTVTGSTATIKAGDQTILVLSQQDAASVDLQLPEATDRAVKAIADAVRQDRESRSPEARARNIAITLLALIALILAATFAWWLVGRLIRALRARSASDKAVDVAPGVGVPVRPLTEVTISFLRLARLVLLGLMAYFFLSFVLALFPAKRDLAASLTAPFFGSLTAFGNGLLGWLPHLALIVLIAFVAFEVMTFMRIMRDEMLAGRFAIRGFEQDWTEPTYRILSFFVAAVAVMAILPQVPGFDTPSFKAVGLVLSALVTFGSASTVANIFGGVVLIYVPSFRVGDFVKIGDAEGEVISKTLFVTQIKTTKNVVVSMPNSAVIGATVFNYSTTTVRGNVPLILHTTVTLGYDVPWRDVEAALVAAALKTANIVAEPAPFVRQTSLDDSYVSYEINAFTTAPLLMFTTYSDLHANMQDECNARGIEILSPGYHAVRDGNHTTIPENYLAPDYRAPGFRVENATGERPTQAPPASADL
jgi:small-conductance mechanosensitive channel